MSNLRCNSFVIYRDSITKEVTRMDILNTFLEVYDALSPDTQNLIVQLLEEEARNQEVSPDFQQTET